MGKKKKVTKRTKKQIKPHPFHRYKDYEVKGDTLIRKNKSCPKCGIQSFLAEHKDRLTCGKCGYMEKKTIHK